MKGRLAALLSLAAALLAGACQTVDLGTPPADVNACMPGQMWFVDQIWPNFLGKDYNGKHCYDSDCHGNSATPLTLVNPIEPATFPLPADWAKNYTAAAHEMNCSDVLDSALLLLPEYVQVHGGGALIMKGGPEEMLVEQWVTQP
ncbi:MAG TPA: hypothetical protein VN962_01375 [Polyangia bacterium]|nr:hypothetical protein [Polyangia bacterium]